MNHATLITTGISARDRARTIRALADPASKPRDFTRPGQVFPLGYTEGGVFARPGHAEAAVDLAELAGLAPAGVICEICDSDGEMARPSELGELGRTHGLPVVSIADLVEYRFRELSTVHRAGEARLPLREGDFRAIGDLTDGPAPLVHIHPECVTGDVLVSRGCDCGERLAQDCPPDRRDHQVAYEILANLGVREFRLLTGDPDTERVPAPVRAVERVPRRAHSAVG